ncbi:lysozyme [Cupriavidus basilensis]
MGIQQKIALAAGAAAIAIAAPFVAYFEGYRPVAYLDPVAIPTICYGHTAGVRLGQMKTKAECDELLRADLGQALAHVDRLATVRMPDTRRAALASFVYNVGPTAFAGSTLLRKLNAGDAVGACNRTAALGHGEGQGCCPAWSNGAKRRESYA